MKFRKAVITLVGLIIVALLLCTIPAEASVKVPAEPEYLNPQTFPTRLSKSSSENDVGGTTHTVSLPTSIAGNLLLVFFVSDGNPTISLPAGWTQLFQTANGTSVKFGAWYRVAEGGEGSSIQAETTVSEQTIHVSYRISGFADVPEVGTSATGTSTYPNSPSLTPSWGAEDTFWIAVSGWDGYGSGVAYPDDYGDGSSDKTGGVDGCGIAVSNRSLNAVSENPGVGEISISNSWVANTVAIRPILVVPTVTTQAVTAITDTTATGNGNITDTGGEDASAWGICYNTTGSPDTGDDTDAGTGSGGAGAFTASMTGLTPGEFYYVRAYATNTVGTSYGTQVEFATDGPPSVTTDAASYVAMTTARLNSTLTIDGGEACEVRFQYYTGAGTWTDNETSWVNGYTTGQRPYADIVELVPDTLYYFRVQAKNSFGTTNGGSLSFTTEGAVNDPTNFKAFPGPTQVVLSWTKGTGATDTLIRYKEEAYPTSNEDGTLVYSGSLGTCTHTGLSSGITHYYSAWGVSGSDYSASYETVMATTLAASDAGEVPGAPTMPPTWFQTPDYTAFSEIPFYDTANAFFDSYEMPRASGWFFTAIFGCIVFGIFVFAISRHPMPPLIAVAVALAIVSLVKLVPMWMMAFTVIFMFGAFQLKGER